MKELKKITILAMVLEEPQTTIRFIESVVGVMDQAKLSFELLIVDDGSPKQTWQTILEAAKKDSRIKGLRLSRNFGKEAALMAGLSHARGDAVIIMDADLQHPPSLLPHFISLWETQNVPIVEGQRIDRSSQSLLKKVVVETYYALFRLLTGLNLRNTSDFVLLDRRVVEEFKALPERQTYFRGLAHWVGHEKAVVPFEVTKRQTGETCWSLINQLRHGILGLSSFSARPVYLVMTIGLLGILGSILLGIQTLYNWLAGNAFPGFSTVILLQLFFGSIEIFCMGLIGIYIVNIYVEVKKRPRYLVDDKTLEEEKEPTKD